MSGYIIITPAKNEADRLPTLIKSINSQNVKPLIWVIVDDESTDGTNSLLKQVQSELNFIRIISNKVGKRNDIARYGIIVKKGVDFAIKQCEKYKLEFEYIAIIDADMWLEKEYFKKMFDAFECKPKMGVASGAIFEKVGKKLVLRQSMDNKPDFTASAMVLRKECYDKIGGFPTIAGSEFAVVIKAENRHWEVSCISNVFGVHTRQSAHKFGKWRGYVRCGMIHYKLNYHPIEATLTGLYFTICKPYANNGPSICGLIYLLSYVINYLSRKEKILDLEIIDYFKNDWKRCIRNVLNKIFF